MLETPTARAKLVIPSRPEHLHAVRELVENTASQAGLPPHEVQRVVTAAFEAVVNAATHGSPLGPENTITVEVYVYTDRLVIEVVDQGPGFKDTRPRQMPGAASNRGRGIPLMRALMDKVEITNYDGGKVTLTKYLESGV